MHRREGTPQPFIPRLLTGNDEIRPVHIAFHGRRSLGHRHVRGECPGHGFRPHVCLRHVVVRLGMDGHLHWIGGYGHPPEDVETVAIPPPACRIRGGFRRGAPHCLHGPQGHPAPAPRHPGHKLRGRPAADGTTAIHHDTGTLPRGILCRDGCTRRLRERDFLPHHRRPAALQPAHFHEPHFLNQRLPFLPDLFRRRPRRQLAHGEP